MSKKSQSQTEQNTSTKSTWRVNGVSLTIAIVLYLVALFGAIWMDNAGIAADATIAFGAIVALIGTYFLLALQIASQWEKAVLLRMGKYRGLAGPGAFWIIPIVDTVANWIDHRVMVTPFSTEKTLTNDLTQLRHPQVSYSI